jgi:predicted transposase/invertase (TIGR01784 family)
LCGAVKLFLLRAKSNKKSPSTTAAGNRAAGWVGALIAGAVVWAFSTIVGLLSHRFLVLSSALQPPFTLSPPCPILQTKGAFVRHIYHVFDKVFKRIMQTASGEAIIGLINALFNAKHPLAAAVTFPNTVTVTKDMKQITSDIEILIADKYDYHIEAQIDDDLNIALRMFRHGYETGLKRKTTDKDGVIVVALPKAIVLYWETTKKTPDRIRLRLVFPDKTTHEYTVKTFKVLNHSVADLAKKKLTLLLPFHILKLRKQVLSAKTSAARKALAPELEQTLKDIFAALEDAERCGLLTKADKEVTLDQLNILFTQIYEPFTEFKEVVNMKDTIILGPIEKAKIKARLDNSLEIAQNFLALGDSPEKVAQATGLPLRKVKALLKNSVVKRTA